MTVAEAFETLRSLGPFVGGFGVIFVFVYKIWIAKIQKDKDKVVDLRLDENGSRQLTIKGYSQPDQAKIVKQFRGQAMLFSNTTGNDRSSLPNRLTL